MKDTHLLGAYRTMAAPKDLSKAERLRIARIAAEPGGARAVAERHGWNANTFKAHDNGTNGFDDQQAMEYAKAFKVTPEWLMFGRGEGPALPAVVRGVVQLERASSPFVVEDLEAIGQIVKPNARDPRPLPFQAAGETLPVFGRGMGGPDGRFQMNGEEIDRVAAPPGLRGAKDAYVIYVDGVSMEPRYHEGEAVYVHPGKPVRQGDYVVIQLRPESDGDPVEGLIKRLVSRSSVRVVAEQYNPAMKLEFDAKDVFAIHRIVLGGEG